MDISQLKAIGLTEGEIKVYLSLLNSGLTTTGIVIKQSGITGSKVYNILDRLIKKGLVSSIIRNKTKYFQASPVSRIRDYVSRQEKELSEKKKAIENILPMLEAKRKEHKQEKYTIQYEGFEGFKTAIYEMLSDLEEGDDILSVGVSLKRPEKYNKAFRTWHEKRKKKKVGCKIIVSEPLKKGSYLLHPSIEHKVVRKLHPAAISICKNKVLIYTWEKPSVLYIHDEDIAKSFQMFFYSIWESGY
ncbi:MAG: TrmB family transcriptional regulator [Candidatus Nanoarchaeia archaeon]